MYPKCVTFNENGLFQSRNLYKLHIFPKSSYNISLRRMYPRIFIHDFYDTMNSDENQIFKNGIGLSFGIHHFYMEDILNIRRQPSPYSSHCTNGQNGESVFPGKYTRKKCEDTCLFRKMIQECHNVPDQWKKFRSEREKVNNKTDQQIRLCLYMSKVKFRNIPCDCPPPCSERQMQVTHQYYKPHYLTKDWEIYFNFQSKMVTLVREFH